MVVIIDGWWGSGKSTLRGLLDGHPNIFVCPIQESVLSALACSRQISRAYEYKDTEALRQILAKHSLYYRIERFANRGTFHSDTSKKSRIYSSFEFDFYKFDKLFFAKLRARKEWNPEVICEDLFSSFHEEWGQYPSRVSERNICVTIENNVKQTPSFLIENFKEAKLLYVIRDPAGILATRAGRQPVTDDYRSNGWERLTVNGLIASGEVERIIAMQKHVINLSRDYPERVLLVNFEELVLSTNSTMDKVAKFLEVRKCDNLNLFTYAGEELLSSSGEKFVGKINDDPSELLSRSELEKIKWLEGARMPILNNLRYPSFMLPRLKRGARILKMCLAESKAKLEGNQ